MSHLHKLNQTSTTREARALLDSVLSEDIRETLLKRKEAALDALHWQLACELRDSMPKGTFAVWEQEKDRYICYVRDEKGFDVEPAVIPQPAQTLGDAILLGYVAWRLTQIEQEVDSTKPSKTAEPTKEPNSIQKGETGERHET